MKVILIGHSIAIKKCIEISLQTSCCEIIAVFTHSKEEHKYDQELFDNNKDKYENYYYNVFDIEKDFNIPVIEYQNINAFDDYQKLISFHSDVLVSVGCRDILKEQIINSFKYAINLHPFTLPNWRGGGLDSWMILNGAWNTTQYATSHFINKTIDGGDIIHQEPYFIPNFSYPLDIFKIRMDVIDKLFFNTIQKLKSNNISKCIQNNEYSYYFPKLKSIKDGRIDLNWNGRDILKFIYAFSYPYPGSFLYYPELYKLHILEASYIPRDNIHPFSIGLIFRKQSKRFWFFVKDGEICVNKYYFEGIDDSNFTIKIGKFLR